MLNVDDLFRQRAQRQPDHPAVLGPGPSRITYAALDEMIESAASVLGRAGVGPGACVGVHVPSGIDSIVLTYAVWRRGGCVVPIPVELAEDEKIEICRTIAVDFVVASPRLPSFVEPSRGGDEVHLPRSAVLVALHSPRRHPPGFTEINAAFIRFTSGTTGTSKGVVLSHNSIRERIDAANEALEIGPADRVLWVLSMSYHFTVSIVAYLTFGATIVLPKNHLAAEIIDSIVRHEATLLYASPMHYTWMADSPKAEPLTSLRLAVSTAMSLDREAAKKFRERFGVPVAQALGVIEVGLPAINFDFAADRPEAVGRILPAFRLHLGDVGLGPGTGEVLLSGKGFLDAYYEPWRTRDEIMRDGWFHTGDIGELDANGCLIIRGRSKDVINTMGMKFFPREVEEVLESHPKVREACVFPRANRRFGEVPCARVVVDSAAPPDLEELIGVCRGRLADYKVPHQIEVVDRLERTPSGKLLRLAEPLRQPSQVG
jgi:long-chain acyl-CoA synthetase